MIKTKRAHFAIYLRSFSALCFLLLFLSSSSAFAQLLCRGCVPNQCSGAVRALAPDHEAGERQILESWVEEFVCYRHWFVGNENAAQECRSQNGGVTEYFHDHILNAMVLFAEEHTAVGMQQMAIIGRFFDAKSQLETQRVFQELQVEAHKDYQPSDDFCWFGTNARSMAATEEKAIYNKVAISAAQLKRQLGSANIAGAESRDRDRAARWDHFTETYCDPKDNNWTTPSRTGLFFACQTNTPPNRERANIDVDYHRLIDEPRTIEVDFTDDELTDDESDIIALSNNIYGHDVLTRKASRNLLQYEEYQHLYLLLRSVAAKRSVAQNTFNAQVSLKASGSENLTGQGGAKPFMSAIFSELGIPEAEIDELIGENPSYYAQLEILGKKIYQNPDFYSNLYDKPANIKRKSVALKAVDLMMDRAIFETELRQEMALSVLLSSEQNDRFRRINGGLIVPTRTSGQNNAAGGGQP